MKDLKYTTVQLKLSPVYWLKIEGGYIKQRKWNKVGLLFFRYRGKCSAIATGVGGNAQVPGQILILWEF
eukprot:snap_masked-scaffold_24-processed-gene-3.14-mRNA-1 protein AED:1.00 eAED:1.00 QI:0/0/0/0/1/1/2/0/68